MMEKQKKNSGFLEYWWVLVAVIAALTVVLCSCGKKNVMGDLQGQWQVMSIEYPDGDIVNPSSPRLYISFNLNVLQLTTSDDLEGFDARYIGQVTGESPDLTFSFPAYTGEDKLDIISRWGIESDPVAVTVESNKSGRMVMKIGNNIVTLRKF